MQIGILQKGTRESIRAEINKEKDLHIYHEMFKALESIGELAFDEKGVSRIFFTGYDRKQGCMDMLFEIEGLCLKSREVAKPFLKKVAEFFGVKDELIGAVEFFFM